ncbi:MAG: tetratricopeptide repeat protein, partial [Myxococcota bacterium]|nr:tetratricopeptide repeat protein [Myxococcota bacterium]
DGCGEVYGCGIVDFLSDREEGTWACYPRTNAHCRQFAACKESGECTVVKGSEDEEPGCIATKASDCKASTGCKEDDMCILVEGSCEAEVAEAPEPEPEPDRGARKAARGGDAKAAPAAAAPAKTAAASGGECPLLLTCCNALAAQSDSFDKRDCEQLEKLVSREPSSDAQRAELDTVCKQGRAQFAKAANAPAACTAEAVAKAASDGASEIAQRLYKAARDLQKSGDRADAVKMYMKAAAQGSAKAWRQLGTLHMGAGKNREAIKAWKKYLKLLPDAADADIIRSAIIRLGRRR